MTNQNPPASAEPRPFTFDRIFSRIEDVEPDEQNAQDEQMSVVDAAFEEGRKWGQEEARAQGDHPLAGALVKLSAQIEQSLKVAAVSLAEYQRQSVQLAYTIASKLAPALIARSPRGEIEALIEDCLAQHGGEPHLKVHVAPLLALELQETLDQLARQSGYDGKLSVVSDETLNGDAVRIDWTGGSVQRDMEQASQQIASLINDRLDTSLPNPACSNDLPSVEERNNEKPA